MESEESILGKRIKRLLHTPGESMGEIVEGCGEAFWLYLIAELDSGEMIQINENDWTRFDGGANDLVAVTRVGTGMGDTEPRFSVSDIEGQRIVDTRDREAEFALVLENGLCLSCPGSRGATGRSFIATTGGATDGLGRRLPSFAFSPHA
jgi:hypothetical protein